MAAINLKTRITQLEEEIARKKQKLQFLGDFLQMTKVVQEEDESTETAKKIDELEHEMAEL